MGNAARQLSDVDMMPNPYAVAEGADALVLVTEWNEFKNLDLERIRGVMRRPIIVDGRNIYDPEAVSGLGFQYAGIGRGYGGHGTENPPN